MRVKKATAVTIASHSSLGGLESEGRNLKFFKAVEEYMARLRVVFSGEDFGAPDPWGYA
jgi:hypothetical protein